MSEDADRQAYAKACAYLNYSPGAKWLAYCAGAASGVVYILLLGVLWLFLDYLSYRGRIPTFRELPAADRDRIVRDWQGLDKELRLTRLRNVGFAETEINRLADLDMLAEPVEGAKLPAREDAEKVWRAQVANVLQARLGDTAAALLNVQDKKPEQLAYDQYDRGLLSLVVRSSIHHPLATPFVGFVAARGGSWMWSNESEPVHSSLPTTLLVLALVLTVTATGLAMLIREAAARATIEATNRLRRAVYHHSFRLGTLAFRSLGPTEAVSVFTRHVEAVHDALFTHLTVYYRDPIVLGMLVIFALFVNFYLAVAFLLFAGLLYAVGSRTVTSFREMGVDASNRAAEHLTLIRESLMLMRLVKSYLMDLFNQSRVERQLSKYAQLQLVRYRAEGLAGPLFMLLALTCLVVLLYTAGLFVVDGYLGLAGLIALCTALVSLYRPIERWLDARRVLRRGYDSAVQVFRFLERRGEVTTVVGAEFLPPLAKQIEFDAVTLREPGTNRMLLEEVSLTIQAGRRIGIVGADDLEKQALVYLIPRLLDPSMGEIRIDEHNLRWVTLESLRNQMAIILQHNLVFHDTVSNNIGCGDPAYTLPRIIEAAKMAHAHHFITRLPQGYETAIGELGYPLDPSEQFRIALARAILRDPALLVIEELQTDLDEDTETLIEDTLNRFLPNRTVIFLPHRLNTIKTCDRLFLLNKGKIVAAGLHKDLLLHHALYRHLHYLEFNDISEQVG